MLEGGASFLRLPRPPPLEGVPFGSAQRSPHLRRPCPGTPASSCPDSYSHRDATAAQLSGPAPPPPPLLPPPPPPPAARAAHPLRRPACPRPLPSNRLSGFLLAPAHATPRLSRERESAIGSRARLQKKKKGALRLLGRRRPCCSLPLWPPPPARGSMAKGEAAAHWFFMTQLGGASRRHWHRGSVSQEEGGGGFLIVTGALR